MSTASKTWLHRFVQTTGATMSVQQFRAVAAVVLLGILGLDLGIKWLAWWYLPETAPITMVFMLPDVFGIGLRVSPGIGFFGVYSAPWVGPARMVVASGAALVVLWFMMGTAVRTAVSAQALQQRPRAVLSLLVMAGAVFAMVVSYVVFQGHVQYAHWPLSSFALSDLLVMLGGVGAMVPARSVVQPADAARGVSSAPTPSLPSGPAAS